MSEEKCYVCNKDSLTKNEIGLSKKFIHREIKTFFCLECLSNYLEIDTDFLLEKIEDFKNQGCDLF